MTIGVGVIGGGQVSRAHIEAYKEHKDTELIALADVSDQARMKVAEKYGIPKTTSEYTELLADSKISLVDVCLPHHLHHKVVLDAFAAGKDVVLEKPISMTVAEADEMISAAEKSGRKFYVSLSQLFLPANIKAKEILDSGELGKVFLGVYMVVGDEFARMNQPDNWKGRWDKAGGGALVDTGYHAVYLFHYWFGKPRVVTCVAKRLVVEPDSKGDDNTICAIEFESGVLVSFTITYSALADPWLEETHFYGTKGSLHFAWGGPGGYMKVVHDKSPTGNIIEVEHPTPPAGSSIKKSVLHFIDCLVNNRKPRVTPNHARDALRTVLALYESSRTGKKVLLS